MQYCSILSSDYNYMHAILYYNHDLCIFFCGGGGRPAWRSQRKWSNHWSGGTKRATSVNIPLLRLQSSEGKFTMSCEIEPVCRSFCRHGSCTFTQVARLVPSGTYAKARGEGDSVNTGRARIRSVATPYLLGLPQRCVGRGANWQATRSKRHKLGGITRVTLLKRGD